MTALDKIKEITAFLKKYDIDDPGKESEIILTHSLKMDRVRLYRDNPVLSEDDIESIYEILERRARREPLQYILGYVDFYGLRIKVGPGVLIPRPETELIIEEVIKLVTVHRSPFTVLDLCTGSGCLALAIAKHLPEASVYGTDISKTAIRYANENAEINGIRNASFFKGSLFEPIVRFAPFDIIVSNPPYIKSSDIGNLQPEIKDWEPRNALDGGGDGLRYYREILSNAPKYLPPLCPPLVREEWGGGFVILEIGEGQAKDVLRIAERAMFENISVIKDYAGIDRLIIAHRL